MLKRLWIPALLIILTLGCGLPGVTDVPPGDGATVTATAAATDSPTPMVMRTPPACGPDEQYDCPGECPGGCGTLCVTPTPTAAEAESPFKIVYVEPGDPTVNTGNLWIIEGNATPRQLTAGGLDSQPQISPDGQQIFFFRELPPTPGPVELSRQEVRVINSDGSGERVLIAPAALPGEESTVRGSDTPTFLERIPLRLAWSADGNYVFFNTRIQSPYALWEKDDLWRVDVASGALTRILEDGQGGTFALSPDGNWIAVGNATSVSIVNRDGSGYQTVITFLQVNTASEYTYKPQPVWVSDGSYALVAISSPEPFLNSPRGNTPTGALWQFWPTGEVYRLAILAGTSFLQNSMEDRVWSQDRAQLAYIDNGNLYLATWNVTGPITPYASGVQDYGFWGWGPKEQFVYMQGEPAVVYLGQIAHDPVQLIPEGEAYIVNNVTWIDANTFIYVSSSGGSTSEIRLRAVGGASYTTLGTTTWGARPAVWP